MYQGHWVKVKVTEAKTRYMSITKGAFHWDIRRPAGDQLSTSAQWNTFGRLMGHPPAAEKCLAQKLGCVVDAFDTIMFINGYHRNQPIDR